MKREIYREKSNIIIGNQFQEETETIIYYGDGSFEILPSEETILIKEEEGCNVLHKT
ncbi:MULTISPECIES: hypothetical protein [Bacillus cereus group]|uniref:hypothetical protein n=1 Tax=Bacillus cereus group TaxID=86661 RepID=UPI00159366E2|nr:MULTISPECIES: hypothetical protein [Bacillus cereus group]MCU5635348.1 hypothetical protein [Bacillus cereus]